MNFNLRILWVYFWYHLCDICYDIGEVLSVGQVAWDLVKWDPLFGATLNHEVRSP